MGLIFKCSTFNLSGLTAERLKAEGCWKLGMKVAEILWSVFVCGKRFKRVGLKQCNSGPFVAHNSCSDVKNQPKEGGLRFLRYLCIYKV